MHDEIDRDGFIRGHILGRIALDELIGGGFNPYRPPCQLPGRRSSRSCGTISGRSCTVSTARARLNGNLELSRRINIVRHSRRAEITTLHEVLWMRPRVPPTPPMMIA